MALREILDSEPGSTLMRESTTRRLLDLDPELERPDEPEPKPEAVSSQQPAQRRRRRRGRRGRRGGKVDGTTKLAEPCLTDIAEPDACFSPERRFDERERRERPPRRYDKVE